MASAEVGLIAEERRGRVLALYRRGVTSYSELARAMCVSTRTIRRDLGAIHARLIAENNTTAKKVYIARQLDRIGFWMREVAQAWEKSKQDSQTRIERQRSNGDGSTQPSSETRTEGQCGDASLIDKIIRLMERESKLLGLDALDASQRRASDAAAATSIMELMRLADMEEQAQVVSGPPLLGHSEPAETEEEIEPAITVTVPLVGSNGNGNAPAQEKEAETLADRLFGPVGTHGATMHGGDW